MITESVSSALEDTDLVVEAFDETQRDLVLGFAVSGDSIPMPIDHLSKLLIGFEPLPLEARAPVLEEFPSPSFTLVIPELTERLLEQLCGVQALISCQQSPEPFAALQRQILPAAPSDSNTWSRPTASGS